jgi:acetyl/propionyl-CoA carboxylase alpha subunit
LPQTGKILRWKPAALSNVRIDHGMLATDEVSPFYDPMVAKVIAYGKTREDAIRLLARAVDDCVLLGVNSNKQFLVNLLVLELKQPDELLVLKQGLLDTLATVLFSMTGLLGGQVVILFA